MNAQVAIKPKLVVLKQKVRVTLSDEQRKEEARKIALELDTLKRRVEKLVE